MKFESGSEEIISSSAQAQRNAVRDCVLRRAYEAGFTLDDHQKQLLQALLDVRGTRNHRDSRGIYVHGPVGRGKSWVTAAWYHALSTGSKYRIHFHEFLERVHREVFTQRQLGTYRESLIDRVFSSLLGDSEVVLFDEFHVHDPGDGRLLSALLDYAERHEISLVLTSNYAPEQLMPSPAWHPIFVPTINKILQSFTVFSLNGPIDYREIAPPALRGFAAGSWLQVEEYAASPHSCEADALLYLRGRSFRVTAVTEGHLTGSFEQLCGMPLSTIEYLEWAQAFSTWTIYSIPAASEMALQAQQRFLNLFDILADTDTTVHCISEHSLQSFVEQLDDTSDISRLTSRLMLLRPDARSGASS